MFKSTKKETRSEKFEKCGEIFHYDGSFKLICTECDAKVFDFKEFLNHFKKKHCRQEENFVASEESDHTSSTPKHDSLDSECFEAVTLLSIESPIDIGHFSTDEENDALEVDHIPESDSVTNQKVEATDKTKLSLQLRKKYACEQCEKKFVSTKGLRKHIHRRHFEPKEYSCTQCKETFTEKGSLWKHERDAHIILTCTMCDRVYKNRRSLRDHMAIHDDSSSFPCQYPGCTKIFKTQRRLSDHNKIHKYKDNYVCEVCGYRTLRKQTLDAHVRTHTGEKPYPCKTCGKRFISTSMVREHSATHATERPHVCDICGATFTRAKALYHHKPLHLGIKKFTCSVCDKAYAQRAGLSAHMRKHKINGKIIPGLE